MPCPSIARVKLQNISERKKKWLLIPEQEPNQPPKPTPIRTGVNIETSYGEAFFRVLGPALKT